MRTLEVNSQRIHFSVTGSPVFLVMIQQKLIMILLAPGLLTGLVSQRHQMVSKGAWCLGETSPKWMLIILLLQERN
uniref:Methyl-CpG-binding domain-containing family protein n=1 Tax=Rhizophora mucronata TaxID=61149 RepID=A0A2P2JQU2_RHIMU